MQIRRIANVKKNLLNENVKKNLLKCKHDEMQINQDTNETYCKCNKMQMRHNAMKQNANVTKRKFNK